MRCNERPLGTPHTGGHHSRPEEPPQWPANYSASSRGRCQMQRLNAGESREITKAPVSHRQHSRALSAQDESILRCSHNERGRCQEAGAEPANPRTDASGASITGARHCRRSIASDGLGHGDY
ncbi:hypothetical protein NDU88_000292 [Pleurodeles waltl]|uniref:Uncharacterized protein n=1 Tax=Pleurodeles waltl TaxID=8319 RepID=A0AAV7MHP1_PLEWA|nr:hypothetical protein NDU88_000292 [Pleurodeles waltl]